MSDFQPNQLAEIIVRFPLFTSCFTLVDEVGAESTVLGEPTSRDPIRFAVSDLGRLGEPVACGACGGILTSWDARLLPFGGSICIPEDVTTATDGLMSIRTSQPS